MSSNIKVSQIVNTMNIYNNYKRKIHLDELKYQYYCSIGDKVESSLMKEELDRDNEKLAQFLDYYI